MGIEDFNELLNVDPIHLDELTCCNYARQLLETAKKIDAQLSAKKRTNANGDLMTTQEFRTWRAKAITAKNHIETRYREIKERIKDIRRGKHATTNEG